MLTGARSTGNSPPPTPVSNSATSTPTLSCDGLLVQYASWHWIFWVNLPIGLVAGLAGWRVLATDQGIGLRGGADALGAILVTAGVMLGVYAIVQRQDWWAGLVALALLAGFVIRQATARTPLLPLRIFASRNVSGRTWPSS
jgi:hypothetical protein